MTMKSQCSKAMLIYLGSGYMTIKFYRVQWYLFIHLYSVLAYLDVLITLKFSHVSRPL